MLSLNDVTTFFQAGEEDLETSWGEVEIMEVVATLAEVSRICTPVNIGAGLKHTLSGKRSYQK